MAGTIEVGQLDLVSTNGLFNTSLASNPTANRTITVPDKSFTLVGTTDLATKSDIVASSANAMHITRQPNWIFNEDGAVTGALQFKITGLYTQSLSGSMKIVITQNGVSDGTYPDYEFDIAGNWRSSDHLWHNTEARVSTSDTSSVNVRFCNNGTDVFVVIGNVTSVWNYPRVVVKDIISNAVIVGYTPDFVISRITTLPTTVNATIVTSAPSIGVGQTWQDVTASRALGTTYTNTTGKPIMVKVNSNGSVAITCIVDGVTLETAVTGGVKSDFTVPNNSTYSIPSGAVLGKWAELR